MIMSSYFNVQYLHQKIRIYADIVQNHTLPGVFPNFWRAVYMYARARAHTHSAGLGRNHIIV